MYVYEDDNLEEVNKGRAPDSRAKNHSLFSKTAEKNLLCGNYTQGNSLKNLPVISQDEYFNYNQRDNNGRMIPDSGPKSMFREELNRSGDGKQRLSSYQSRNNAQ